MSAGNKDKTGTKLTPSHIVCIGASAGGLEAIEAFFSHMPSESGLAFVVIQHLSPDYKSLMVELLSKKTQMEVLRADNNLLVESNKVYLIPPKKNLKIFHGKLLLTEQTFNRGINLPIDVFMQSLAEDIGEQAIGVILSGTGSDGMRGVRSIKEAGGMIMVQDEETARFDGMPRSALSTGLADYILAPEEMPTQLLAYVNHLQLAKKSNVKELMTDEENLTRIFYLVREKHKVDFTHYKKSTVLRRLERRMTINHQKDIKEYVKFIENNSREVSTLYQELLIGVTSFFRDEEAFKLLEEKWLPELLKKHRNQEIRFWVVGCSTGEEAYSLAILCRECQEKLQIQANVKIFSTDVDNNAVIKAGNGVYPFSITADINPRLLQKYFLPRGDEFHIVRSIREMVVFAQHNVLKDPPFTNIHLVSCRNLLIYLQPVLQQKVLHMFNFSLSQGGILFLGSSESTGELMEYFEPLNHKWKIFRSKGRSSTVGKDSKIMLSGGQDRRLLSQFYQTGGRYNTENYHDTRQLERMLDTLHGEFLPTVLLVNEQREIIRVVGDTSRFLRLPTGRMVNDVTHLAVQELIIPLATGLQKVFSNGENINYSNIRIQQEGESERINMMLRLLKEKKGQPSYAMILIEKAEIRQKSKVDAEEYDLDKEAQQRINDLEQELQFSRENLQATIEELETSNEELQATNEELLASNEELQSTNEELQSVNEELHTVNAEFQSKIMELAELNNDMDNLLNSIDIGTVFLDENLEIRKFTAAGKNLFNITPKDIGRPFSHFQHNLKDFEILPLIISVKTREKPIERQVQTENGNWYILRILPYYITQKVVSGIVITTINIDELIEMRRKLAKREEWLSTAAQLMRIGYWEIDSDTGITHWSDGIYDIHEVEKSFDHNVENGINFYHPQDQPKIESAVKNALENGIPFDLELRFVTAKGNHLWVRTIGKVEKKAGRVMRVFGAFQDITSLKRTEIDLHNSLVNQHKLEKILQKEQGDNHDT